MTTLFFCVTILITACVFWETLGRYLFMPRSVRRQSQNSTSQKDPEWEEHRRWMAAHGVTEEEDRWIDHTTWFTSDGVQHFGYRYSDGAQREEMIGSDGHIHWVGSGFDK